MPHDDQWADDSADPHQPPPNFRTFRGSQATPTRFQLLNASEVDAHMTPKRWLIDGVLESGVNMLFGAYGSGKSFIALDIAMHVALGLPWRGRRTQGGVVVYVVAEDAQGARTRRNGWRLYHNASEDDGRFIALERPVLLNYGPDVDGLILALRNAGIAPALIVFDTLSRCIPGVDENSNGEMGRVVAALERILEETGAMTALVVHHKGNEHTTRARGASAVSAAMQGVLQVDGDPAKGVTLKVDKERNGKKPDPFSLSFHEVFPAEDVSTLVVALGGDQAAPDSERPADEARAARNAQRAARAATRIRREEVYDVLRKAKRLLTPKGVADKLGKPQKRKAVQNHLTALVRSRHAFKNEEGQYGAC